MLRTIVERLSRNKVIKRRLPAEFGGRRIWVSPDAQLRWLKPGKEAFDLDLLRVAKSYIGETSEVWDIGANVGLFAFAAAALATRGKVLAVEADLWLAQLMRKSAASYENRGLNLQVLPVAISDQNGVAIFLMASRGRASNCLEEARGRSMMRGVRENVMVPTLTLDTLLGFRDPPSFLKIDVEGAEALVLRGASRILEEVPPTIYVEVGERENEEVAGILKKVNYILFDGSKPVCKQDPLSRCNYNTLAVPEEKVASQKRNEL